MKRFILVFTAIFFIFARDASASQNEGIFHGLYNIFTGNGNEYIEKKNRNKTFKTKTSPRTKNSNFTQPSQTPFLNKDLNLNHGENNTNNNIQIERAKTPLPQDNETSLISDGKNSASTENTKQPQPVTPATNNEQLILAPTLNETISTNNSEKEKEAQKLFPNSPFITPIKDFSSTVLQEVKKEEEIGMQTSATLNESFSTKKENVAPTKSYFKKFSEVFIEKQSTPQDFIDISLGMILESLIKHNKSLNESEQIDIVPDSYFITPTTSEEKFNTFKKGQSSVDLPYQSVFDLKDGKFYVTQNEQTLKYESIKITELDLPRPRGLIIEKTQQGSGNDIHYHIKSITITNKAGKVKVPLFDILTSIGFTKNLGTYLTKASKTTREDACIGQNLSNKTALLYNQKDSNGYEITMKVIRNKIAEKNQEITDLLIDK